MAASLDALAARLEAGLEALNKSSNKARMQGAVLVIVGAVAAILGYHRYRQHQKLRLPLSIKDVIGSTCYTGSCRCGGVRFSVQAPDTLCLAECHITPIMQRGTYLIVPTASLRLSNYSTSTLVQDPEGGARFMFCSICGVHVGHFLTHRNDVVAINSATLNMQELRKASSRMLVCKATSGSHAFECVELDSAFFDSLPVRPGQEGVDMTKLECASSPIASIAEDQHPQQHQSKAQAAGDADVEFNTHGTASFGSGGFTPHAGSMMLAPAPAAVHSHALRKPRATPAAAVAAAARKPSFLYVPRAPTTPGAAASGLQAEALAHSHARATSSTHYASNGSTAAARRASAPARSMGMAMNLDGAMPAAVGAGAGAGAGMTLAGWEHQPSTAAAASATCAHAALSPSEQDLLEPAMRMDNSPIALNDSYVSTASATSLLCTPPSSRVAGYRSALVEAFANVPAAPDCGPSSPINAASHSRPAQRRPAAYTKTMPVAAGAATPSSTINLHQLRRHVGRHFDAATPL